MANLLMTFPGLQLYNHCVNSSPPILHAPGSGEWTSVLIIMVSPEHVGYVR